ncbi:MAG: cupin domain-containing protein, partial [Candidatus Dormibacteraeota bacterium]|nr:cupin domain-containing protein [Candidatus Dormibacteraeota bacterium]
CAAGPPLGRTQLLSAKLTTRSVVERVEVARVDLAPGQGGGLHLHPCPVVGYVIAGAVRYQVEGEGEQTLAAGQAFYEPAHQRILHFDNASRAEPASFAAFYLVGPGQDQLIEMID